MARTEISARSDVLLTSLYPLAGQAVDYDRLMHFVGEAHVVLLGEASHGTHEFYRARAEITKRLVTEKGFTAIAVEADWPDASGRAPRYVSLRPLVRANS